MLQCRAQSRWPHSVKLISELLYVPVHSFWTIWYLSIISLDLQVVPVYMIYDTFFALLVRFDLQPFIDNNIFRCWAIRIFSPGSYAVITVSDCMMLCDKHYHSLRLLSSYVHSAGFFRVQDIFPARLPFNFLPLPLWRGEHFSCLTIPSISRD